jgi:heme/copper-type cytochrome/quinol oxidase subunit 3
LAVAAASLALAAIAGPPYLGASGVNGWVILSAVALFAALFAVPFVIEARLRETHPDSDSRWDRAVPIWGAVALLLVGVGALIGATEGFGGDSLVGSAGLVAAGDGGLVVIAVASMMLAG